MSRKQKEQCGYHVSVETCWRELTFSACLGVVLLQEPAKLGPTLCVSLALESPSQNKLEL